MSEDQIYELKVTVHKKVHRTIGMRGNHSLCRLAETIIKAFNFDFDHAFGFYSNIKNIYDSMERYEVFVDDGYECSPGSKGVRNIFVSDVFDVGKKMLFLFDYGDGWEFIVECTHISHAVPKQRYPQIFTKIGRAPRQYR